MLGIVIPISNPRVAISIRERASRRAGISRRRGSRIQEGWKTEWKEEPRRQLLSCFPRGARFLPRQLVSPPRSALHPKKNSFLSFKRMLRLCESVWKALSTLYLTFSVQSKMRHKHMYWGIGYPENATERTRFKVVQRENRNRGGRRTRREREREREREAA